MKQKTYYVATLQWPYDRDLLCIGTNKQKLQKAGCEIAKEINTNNRILLKDIDVKEIKYID